MQVNRNSWHYKWLAYTQVMSSYYADFNQSYLDEKFDQGQSFVDIYESVNGKYPEYKRPTNFCQYWRMVLLWPTAILFANLLIITALLSLFAWQPLILAGTFGVLALVALVILVIALVVAGSEKVKDKLTSVMENPTSFVGNAYKNYKDNVCTIMEYKKDE